MIGALQGAVAVVGLCLLVPSAHAQAAAVEALLRLHHQQRVAHVLGDASLLTASFADRFVEMNRGRVGSLTPSAARDRFTAYFAAVRFLEWENLRPPRVRISPDGRWAELVVEKRVRTIPADTLRSKREDAATFAWTERWVRDEGTWRLATIASTDRPSDDAATSELADRVRASEILRRARDAIGGEAAVARIATLRFRAECEGPGGPFVTEVASARDGRVAFAQRFPARPPFAAGISLEGAWRMTGDGRITDSLGAAFETVISAHELHLLAVAPEARYAAPHARARESRKGRELDVVRFTDRLGADADFLFDTATGRPAGFRVVNHTGRGTGEVVTWFADWRPVGEVDLPFEITIMQGDDLYRYRVVEASSEWITDMGFRPND